MDMTDKNNDDKLAATNLPHSRERRDLLKKLGITAGALAVAGVTRTASAQTAAGDTPTVAAAGVLPMTTPIMELGLTPEEKKLIPAHAYPLTKGDLIALFTPGNTALSEAVKALTVGEIETVKGVFLRKWKSKTGKKGGGASAQMTIGDIKCCCCPCCCATAVTKPTMLVNVA